MLTVFPIPLITGSYDVEVESPEIKAQRLALLIIVCALKTVNNDSRKEVKGICSCDIPLFLRQ